MSTIQPKCVSYFCSYPDVVQKMYSERLPVSCSSTCHDFIYFGNHEMVKNAKTWLSWEQKIIFLKNQNILNLCLFLHFWEHFFSRTPSSSQYIYIYVLLWKCFFFLKTKVPLYPWLVTLPMMKSQWKYLMR